MQLWRFLLPSALGFTVNNLFHEVVDKVTGTPPRTVQAAKYVFKHARQGDPEGVLRVLDTFALEERWLMSVGPEKGPLIRELAGRLPTNARILDLGPYCGYSSIMIARALGPQCSVVSIEIYKQSVASASSNEAVAGVSDQISFLHGPSNEMIFQLDETFDLVFLDHWRDLYKSDLHRIEKQQLIRSGSIVVMEMSTTPYWLALVQRVPALKQHHRIPFTTKRLGVYPNFVRFMRQVADLHWLDLIITEFKRCDLLCFEINYRKPWPVFAF